MRGDLKRQGLQPTKITRLTARRDGTKVSIQLGLVQVTPDEVLLSILKSVCSLKVKVKSQRSKAGNGM